LQQRIDAAIHRVSTAPSYRLGYEIVNILTGGV
jgi:hypothetical protein